MAIPIPKHVYRFRGSLDDYFRGPALVPIGGALTANEFAFDPEEGLTLRGAIVGDAWTIAFRHRHDSFSPIAGASKLVDFKQRTTAGGVYAYDNGDATFSAYQVLDNEFEGDGASLTNEYIANQWQTTIVRRDPVTGYLTHFIDGQYKAKLLDGDGSISRPISFDDASHLVFFLSDRPITQLQEAGEINYLATWNRALTDAEIAAIPWSKADPIPLPSRDFVERVKAAVVAILSANADIQAIARRSTNLVTSWNPDMNEQLPVIAYRVPVAAPGGGAIGDTREFTIVFSAIAPRESDANALLEVIENIPWAPTLAALPHPLDAYMRIGPRQEIPWDSDSDVARSDLTMTCTATK